MKEFKKSFRVGGTSLFYVDAGSEGLRLKRVMEGPVVGNTRRATRLPPLIAAPANLKVRCKWLERREQAILDEGVEYLIDYETVHTAAEGVRLVYGFLDSWFPRKALWASPAAIKGNAASFKKFFTRS